MFHGIDNLNSLSVHCDTFIIMQFVIGIYLFVLRDLQYNRIERLDANFLQLSKLFDLYVYNCLLNLIFCTNSLNLLFLWKVSYS